MMIAEHKHLAEQGVELVELRLDYIRRPVNMRRLLDDRPTKVVATCRRPKDSGKWMRSEADRLTLLRTAIADGVDYVDLESDIAEQIPRYGATQRIISYHNFEETPANIEKIHQQLKRLDPDIIKIATKANNPIDNIRTLRLCQDKTVPTVAFCMGDMGVPSRILCGKLGAPMTYATFHEDRQLAPGQLSYEKMISEFHYEDITENTQVLGVIADPVAHSLSPLVHNANLRQEKLDMIYLPFRVPKEHLAEFIEICPELGVVGLSVTIPHKESILRMINALDDNVAGIRAANTVVFREANAYGFNTDCEAAIRSLQKVVRPELPREERLRDRRILILGAGGVARAVAFGLHRAGAKVHICARDYRKSEKLAFEFGCESLDWPARQKFAADILINCTPVGMHPNLDESPFEQGWFDKRMTVFDTVYNPEQTLFIKSAKEAGCETITGVDMFVEQAARQFKLFTGKPADQKLMRTIFKQAISPARYH